MLNDELLFISSNENINAVCNDFSISDGNKAIEHSIIKTVKRKRSFWNLFRKNKKIMKKALKKNKKTPLKKENIKKS